MTMTPAPHALALTPDGWLLDGHPLMIADGSSVTVCHEALGPTTADLTVIIDPDRCSADPTTTRAEAAVAEHLSMRSGLTPRRAQELARDIREAGLLRTDEQAGY